MQNHSVGEGRFSVLDSKNGQRGGTCSYLIVYRFGKPGSPELEFPSSPDGSLQKFEFSHYFRPQFDSAIISFSVNYYTYNVFDTTDGEGNQQMPERTAGVSVSSRSKKGAELRCSPGRTNANWFLIDGVIPWVIHSQTGLNSRGFSHEAMSKL